MGREFERNIMDIGDKPIDYVQDIPNTFRKEFCNQITSKSEIQGYSAKLTYQNNEECLSYSSSESFLVGFKFLTGVNRQDLVNAAIDQNKKAHLNLTIANDSTQIHDDLHPVILVTSEGGVLDLFGTKEEVTNNIVEFIKKRLEVTRYHSEQIAIEDSIIPEKEKQKFQELLSFAQDTHLLYNADSNVCMRYKEKVMVSPIQEDIKTPIDLALNHSLYLKYPYIQYILHFHQAWGIGDIKTTFPYPSGVKEEADEIMSQIENKDISDGFGVELINHGFLLGLTENNLARLKQEWEESTLKFKQHLIEVYNPDFINEGRLKPVFSGNHIVGIVREHPDGAVVFLIESVRGRGVGRNIVDQLIERQLTLQTIDKCRVAKYYKHFGFKESSRSDVSDFYFLYPPPIIKSDPLFEKIDEWRIR